MFVIDAPRPVLALVRRCDRDTLLDLAIGLSLDPAFQSSHYRLITLAHLTLAYAHGDIRPTHAHLVALLNGLLEHDSGLNEYDAEDAFCVSVGFQGHERLLVNGMYVASDYPLQRLLDAVFSEDFPAQSELMAECEGLLVLGDAIARRARLSPDVSAPSAAQETEWPADVKALQTLGRAARFSSRQLQELGVSLDALAPFILEDTAELPGASFGRTALNVRPLIRDGEGVVIPVPSFISPALRLRLADRVARGVVPRAARSTFHEVQFARWVLFDARMSGARALSNDDVSMPEPAFDMPGDYIHAVLRFDEDKLAHLVVLGCDWRRPPEADIAGGVPAGPAFEAGLSGHLRASFHTLREQFGCEAGLTIVVHDSPGWGLSMDLPNDFGPDWFVVGADPTGLTALFADPAFSLLDLWKMKRQAREMAEAGLVLAIWPDLLDWWVVWRDQGFSFWPENIDVAAFGGIAHQGVDVGSFRRFGRRLGGRHQAPSAHGGAEEVERWIDRSTPPGEWDKPIYFATMSAVMEQFRAVAETDRGYWWVVPGRPPFSAEDRTWLKLLWQGSIEWVLKLALAAPPTVPTSQEALEIRLLPVPEQIVDAPDTAELRRGGPGGRIVNLVLPPRFIDLFIAEDNAGDRALVSLLAQSIRLALDLPLDEEALAAWVDEVTADPDLKMIHVTMSGDLALHLDRKVHPAPFRTVQQADCREAERTAFQRLQVRRDSGLIVGQRATADKATTGKVLRALVDEHWLRCRSRLSTLDRRSVVVLASRLVEALHRERVSGERGARARLRLYANYDRWATHNSSGRDSAFRAYRTIVEMAVCESPPTGGRTAALSDIDALAGELMALFRAADQSDAVHHDLVSPELRFRPDGTWEAVDGGSAAYMENYLRACIADSIADDVDNYGDLFEAEVGEPPTEGDPMLQAYAAEFGVEMVEVAAFQNALLEIADDLGVDVVDLTESELSDQLAARTDPTPLPAFLHTFALSTRPRWDAPPAGFRADDIYPWLFERRLSLMVRPLIRIANGADDRLVYGVRQLKMGLHYAAHLLETATWDKSKLRSEEARAWVDAEVNRRGLAFEHEIGDRVRERSWSAFVNEPMTRIGAPAKLGDLDVLAVSPDGAIWMVIECKWFGRASSSREVASWLQDYHGHDGDKLDRHLRRTAWIRENAAKVAEHLKIPAPERVLGRIVTTTPAPLSYVRALPEDADLLTRRTLLAALAEVETPSPSA
ncbi:NERD domain-containing protein [Brevundimonas aurantiaca]|uniref:NERD domain-containing protein n=1 Tax=Brevundimonas aurantiaca TaxID=74316 RepID=UPI00174E1BCE|nr:NERD domain-containing protein [Brevundimonas aurantiaca]